MTWLRRTEGVAAPSASPSAVDFEPAAPDPVEHAAPGLKQALERMPRPGASVLDLGPALEANIDFFNRLGARLRIVGLEESLRELDLWAAPAKLAAWERAVAPLFADGDGERYHLILAWDLPNYLGRERWAPVAKLLAERLAPGGMLHLLARTGKQMPATPSHYRCSADDHLKEELRDAATVTPPRFSHGEIERLHEGLAAARSFLDKTGAQEFVLEHAGELNLPPRPVAQPRKPRSYYPG